MLKHARFACLKHVGGDESLIRRLTCGMSAAVLVSCRDVKGYKAVDGVKDGVAGVPYVNRLGRSPEVPQQQSMFNQEQVEVFKGNLAEALHNNLVATAAATDVASTKA
jgi:hypothetical protein